MKKVLSLMLAVALILTTMAVPMVASAAEGDVTVTAAFYKNNAVVDATNPVYPGDEVTLKITAKADTNEATVTNANAMFELSEGLTIDSANLPAGVTQNATNPNRSAYVNMSKNSISTDGDELAAIPVAVGSAATGDQTVTFDENYGAIVNGNDLINTTWTNATMTVASPSVSVSVKGNTEGAVEKALTAGTKVSYTDTTSVTVTLTPTGNIETATITKTGTEAANFTDNAYTIAEDDAGDYTIKVKMVGGSEQTYEFIYSAFQADATISLTKPDNVVRAENATVSVPVTIEGIGDYTAAMVQFDVTYDPSKLTLDETTNAETTSYTTKGDATANSITKTVVVGKNNDATITKNAPTVTTLDFAVATTAALGDATVSISVADEAGKVVLNTVGIVVDDTELGADVSSVTFVILPEIYATVSNEPKEATKTDYDVTVTPTDGVSVSVITSETQLDENTDWSTKYDANKEITTSYKVDTENVYYYVIAKVGTVAPVYVMVDEHESLLDQTGPTIDATELAKLNDATWVATADKEDVPAITLDAATLVKDADFDKFMYKLNETSEWTEATSNSIAIPANTTTTGIKIKAVDTLGNGGEEATITRNYDGSAPTFTAAVGDFNDDEASKNITVSDVNDEGGSGVASVEVYFVEDETETSKGTLTATEGVYTYNATAGGTYYVVVKDTAGNATKSDALVVDLGKINVAGIKVAIVSGNDCVADKFVAGKDNGMFSYIKIITDGVTGGDTTFKLLKGTDEVTVENNTIELTGSEATAGAYTLTVTTVDEDDEHNNNSATYNFNIAANAEGMYSVDNKPYYNAYDYAIVNALTTGDAAAATPSGHTLESKFTGGLFSADVTGDLGYDTADVNAILQALQKVQIVGEYEFNILNGFVTTSAE